MKKIVIDGNKELTGTINICGAKNSAVALIPAAILCDEEVKIYNVPNISDRDALLNILEHLNCKTELIDDYLRINLEGLENKLIPEDLSNKLRASYYFMGALLSKYKFVEMYFPGGCNIGARPINLHLKGFEMLGAKVTIDGNKYTISADELKGARIYLDIASVGATVNLMLAAVKAKGITIISNAAREPEITNVATFLNNMGAKITGVGTSEIKIEGVEYLHKAIIDVIPDRIEAGTYAIIGAALGRDLVINNVIEEHLEALLSKLKDMGVSIKSEKGKLIINKAKNLKPINIKTLVFPGFPTDLGQPITTLLTQAQGMSLFEETIYENRFGHIKYLNKMGANINANTASSTAIVMGPTKLKGCDVVATDLRAGAAMVIAGLIAEGTTRIDEIKHILRGYENIIEKLQSVGANIRIEEI
ncbi:MAG: UDP-N-acetylglucosamine 1-carboxyvinyltransferase [Bacilli bacterium]|nr:UDP-N-acetylglucosamine 1-carboxyvinyltransferase [Bacilli bacterium]